MTNADRFKAIFGLYATELWAKPEKEFLKWLNADVPDTNVGDMISRQAAIETVRKAKSIGQAHRMLAQLPSAQLAQDLPNGCTDTISRQAALNLIEQSCCDLEYACDNVALRKEVEALPSAQPEIIHCKDCKFFSHGYCRFHDAKFVRPDGYCYWGEQKEGEQHD